MTPITNSESPVMDEYWVTLDGLPNYSISNYGRVVNNLTERELKPRPNANGDLIVSLYHNGKRYDTYLRRLVALCFFLNYREGIEVKHINGNQNDCSVLNLTLGVGCREGKGLGKGG